MLARIHNFISSNQLAATGDKILLGVSGGIDSMVMASLFLHLPFEKAIAHCNFSLRGQDADQDESFVREFSEKHEIRFHNIRFNTKEYAGEKGISTQMAARELRYEWFGKVCSEIGYTSIAVAHNLDDHAETMLINLVRGTGPAGLTGMKPKTGIVIRPLLFASREDIAAYAAKHGISYREDRTNAEVRYTRNRIRHLVMPVLKDINPSILRTLEETSFRFSEISQVVDSYTENLRAAIMRSDGNDHIYDVVKLRAFSDNGTILYGLFRRYGLNNSQIEDLRDIIRGRSGSMVKTATGRIVHDRQRLIVTSQEDPAPSPLVISNEKELGNLREFGAEISDIDDSFILPKEKNITCIDADRLVFPLILRKWNKGDYFFPLGMKGRKKLSDYFTDMKYSIVDKERKLVLESGTNIVCIPCERTDERFRVTGKTRRVLILRPVNLSGRL